ncbi:MAG: TMEM175 family protein [Flavobacteriaceae bacterium]|nr:DUF1211 domain-containing protein [Flavobacteriaceae bacterium]HRV54722.1 TMEM175 family protein [Mangrovimonas sp.]
MKTNRLEAFSDGVLAIVITIMVLEFKIPETPHLSGLYGNFVYFISYLLSFVYLAIYWNNHHHIFQALEKVNGRILWANMHLLFWLSLIPFATQWGSHYFPAKEPLMFYGCILLMCSIASILLIYTIKKSQPPEILEAIKESKNYKSLISLGLYLVGIIAAIYNHWLAVAVYFIIAVLWIIPNKKIEEKLNQKH